MNKKIIVGVVVILAVLAGFAVFQNKKTSNTENKIKVGVILPLSGEYSAIGESVKNSMEMSFNDLENKNIELIYEDDQFDSAKALSAYNKLQSVDDVDIVVGLVSPTLEVIKPIINESDELMFTLGNESSIENDNVFEVIPWATELFRVLGTTVSGKYKKIGIVYATDWKLAEPNRKMFIDGLAGSNYVEVPVSPNSDVRTEVAKMIEQGVDAYTVFLPVDQGSKFINEVTKQAGNKRPQIICDGNIELTIGDYLQKVINKDVFEGCISTMIADTTSKEYIEKYKQIYGADPNFLAVYGYDAVQIISNVLDGKDKQDWKNVLEDDGFSYKGVSGNIMFDDTGSRVLESEVHIYKNGAFVKLEN